MCDVQNIIYILSSLLCCPSVIFDLKVYGLLQYLNSIQVQMFLVNIKLSKGLNHYLYMRLYFVFDRVVIANLHIIVWCVLLENHLCNLKEERLLYYN